MDSVTIVLLVIMVVLFVLYVGRRRGRLKKEED
jgi:hypothetical protein